MAANKCSVWCPNGSTRGESSTNPALEREPALLGLYERLLLYGGYTAYDHGRRDWYWISAKPEARR